uniref:non-ribosomal peptide synthetase n=1 Tax=Lentzea indica TaxID=2604800 RepID=UPI001FE2BC08|nr:non-ribosomal peptide synthetase [Lentzea indica]
MASPDTFAPPAVEACTGTDRPVPWATLAELVEAQARTRPEAPAVIHPGGELTFAELDAAANRLAHLLISRGAGPEKIVALALPRSADIVVAQLAVLKAGAAYLPIDPDYPPERIAFMLGDAKPVLVVDHDLVEAAALSTEDGPTGVRPLPAHPAYVIYTSGSTGTPKGVVVTHRGIASFSAAEIDHFQVRPGDGVLQFSSPSFDASVLELCMSLPAGAALVVPPPGPLLGEHLAHVLAEQRITHALVPPVALATVPAADLPCFRGPIVGGDACPAGLVDRWAPGRRMINAYGPTESTVVTTWSDPLSPGGVPPIGRPIWNTKVHVLDENLAPVPVGTPGELHVSGIGLARGYLNRPGLTADRFIADPYGAPGERMYSTGDLVRWNANGELEFVGRTDHQVKIRGFRVEPGEIEAALRPFGEVVVLARQDDGHKRLVAYLVPANGKRPSPDELRRFVADRLPSHLVPSAFVLLDRFPLSPNGKLDRSALPKPTGAAFTAGRTAARTGSERLLAGIWAELLGIDQVGVDDDFFGLGGDSILATKVLSRVRACFGVDLTLRTIFDAGTLGALAELLPAPLSTADEDRIVRAPRGMTLPLSPAQQRLWFLDDLTSGGVEYNTGVGLRLSGPLDLVALRSALDALVSRHESLRTTFDSIDGQGVQLVAETSDIPLRVVEATTADAVDDVLADELRRPFDLRRGPLTRAVLVRVTPAEHVLLLCQHHIVTDGWSVSLLVDELAELYAGAELPALTIQYPDFAVWQRERLTDQTEHLRYWENKLAGLEVLNLPTDRPRPRLRTTAGAVHRRDLGADLVRALTTGSRERGATLFMTLIAAVQVLLARYSGQRDIAVGTASSGRNRAELERLAGFFVNTVVLRSTVDGSETFDEFLAAVRETVLEAFTHDELPFDQLVEALAPERDPSRTPLVQAMVVLQNATVHPREINGLHIREHDLPRPSARFDLVIEFLPRGDGLNLAIEYNTDLFDAATVERMAGHLEMLLSGIAEDPSRPVDELALLTDAERHQVLVAWNDTAHDVPEATLPTLFAEQVRRTPDTIAVGGDEPLTYRELDARANHLAHRLIDVGVRPDQPVGLLIDRSADVVIAELAILKAGGAYVPLDVRAPADRMRLVLTEAGASVLVTDDADRLVHSGHVVVIGSDACDTDPAVPLHPDNLAYVMYTSGSTGTPKGVAVRHSDVVALAHDRCFRNGAHERVLLHSPLAFDASTYELWAPLLHGGQVVVAPPIDLDADSLGHVIKEHDVTGLWLTAGLFRLIAQDAPSCLSGVREVWTGGDVVPAQAVRRVLNACPGITVVDGYGPTETTTFATHHTISEPVPDVIPIGHPQDNMQVYVLDDHLRPVPIGVPGELFLSGRGLARGYRNRPGMTAQRFIANPFSSGERMYRTGDVVRWTNSGEIEYLGRTDDQVKIRGFRIELGEVEAALLRHDTVAEAVAVVQETSGNKRLVAYVVAAPGVTPSAPQLRGFVSQTLPDYMVPSAIVTLDELPLSRNGKLDRLALPQPTWDSDAGFVAPRTEAETVLARIWADVLGTERVGVDDNFFELGGDSILSIQVVSKARQAGLGLSSKDVFLHQTIAALAAHLTPVEPERTEQGPVTGPVPLTPMQRWGLETNTGRPQHFNQALFLELTGDVDEQALRAALRALLDHHDALRMRFRQVDGQWVQYNAPVTDSDVLTVSTVDDIRTAADAVHASFDLGTGPLLKAALFNGTVLFLAAHHQVVDGVSWRILLEDLETAYRGGDLGPKTTSFRDWARHLTELPVLPEEREYWADMEPLPVPVDGTGANTVASTRAVTVRLDAAETRALLQDVPGAYRTQVNDVLLTALGRVLSGWTGRNSVQVQLEGHGREEFLGDVSRTVGWFTAMFPVTLDVSGAGWGTVLKSVKEQLRAVPRRGVGYGLIGGSCAPQVSFNYLGHFDLSTGGLYRGLHGQLELSADPAAARPHLLDVVGRVDDRCLEFTWFYSEEVHEQATVHRLADEMIGAIREIVEHCARPGTGGRTPSDFPLARLDQEEVDRIAGDGRDIEDVYPLTPMQAGMVFHRMARRGSVAYFQQITFVVDGDVDVLSEAWQRVVDRTPVLRSHVVWEGVDEPLQVVRRTATVPIVRLDWTEADRDEELQALLARDRAEGIDIGRAPLMRVTLARLPGGEVQVLWTFDHVVLDGWSLFLVLSEVLRGEPAARRPFRDYLTWLGEQDQQAADDHWQLVLRGLTEPTALPYDRQPMDTHSAESTEYVRVHLPSERSTGLREFAQTNGLTVNTVVQGAWAVLLSRYSGQRDVCFGATVSGRPTDLPGVESIVGLFINTIPVRVDAHSGQSVRSWLMELQAAQSEARRFEHVPLNRMRTWTGLPERVNLFDSIVAFENYPAAGLGVRELGGIEVTNYPLAVVAYPGDELGFTFGYDPALFDRDTVARLAGHLLMLLGDIVDDPRRAVLDLPMLTGDELRRVLVEWNDTAVDVAPATLAELFEAQVTRTRTSRR